MVEYNAVSLDGVDDYVEANAPTNGYQTVSVIYRTTDISVPNSAILYQSQHFTWFKQATNDWQVYFYNPDDGLGYRFRGIYPASEGGWHHDVLVFDRSTKQLFLYRDGELIATKNYDYTVSWTPTSTLWIGKYADYFSGGIALVQLYTRMLSAEEVQQLYQDPMNPPTGLVLWYAPDSVDVANGLWRDKSGNGNDGTIFGAMPIQLRPLSESTPTAGKPYAYYFDGEDDYGLIPRGLTIPRPTMIFIFRGENLLESKIIRSEPWRVIVGFVRGKPWLELWDDNGTRISSFLVDYQLKDNNVYLLAFAYGADGVIRAYVNGQLVDTYTALVNNDVGVPTHIYVGAYEPGVLSFKGNIYAILIYNRALSDSEIQAIYNDPDNPPLDGLVLWYHPDSVDMANGKWLNKAPILPTWDLVEALDATKYNNPLEIPVRYSTAADIEDIWELNTLRLNYPHPKTIQNRIQINNVKLKDLNGGRVAFTFGKEGDAVDLTFYVKRDELPALRAESALGTWKIRTPVEWLEYYGDYVVDDVDIKPLTPAVFEATLKLEKMD